MANRTASIVVRGTVDGKRVNWSLKRAKQQGLTGSYWIKWRKGDNQTWDGPHKDEWTAKAAKAKREREFKLIALGVPVSVTTSDVTLTDAIAAFIVERTASQDASSVRRWKWELNRFATITGKTYLREIDREDVFEYWNSFKADGAKPRTIHNRIQSLLTFLKNRGITGLLKTGEMPAFDEKDVDYYTESNPTELTQFFSVCNSEERLAFMFFLYSGCREREVMFACWNDIDFINRTYTVRPKQDLGFRTKNGQVRAVPLPQVLIDALKTYVLVVGSRRLIFVNTVGGAQGHFLYKCKEITFRAGLNCGHCINKQGKSCAEHAVCANWGLHKFRRTWATMHLLNGTPMPLLQNYIGHSDMQTLNRYKDGDDSENSCSERDGGDREDLTTLRSPQMAEDNELGVTRTLIQHMTKKPKQSKKAMKNSKRTRVPAQPEEEPDTLTTFSATEAPQASLADPGTPEANVAIESQQATEVAAPATPVTESETAPKVTRSETAKSNIREGLKQHAIAGRPTKSQLVLVFGQKGYAMTWAQRTARYGITPETFQAALAKGVPAIRLGPGAQTVVEKPKEKV